MQKELDTELAIIIYSCKKNSDMWSIFSRLFKKYWSECAYKIILVTDECTLRSEDYIFDEIIECDDNWSNMIFKGFGAAATPYVMLWMDDYLLCDNVNNNVIQSKIDILKKYDGAFIRLTEGNKSKGIFSDEDKVGYFEPGEAYCYSLQACIWSVDFLKKTIQPTWTPWDFERIGSIKAPKSERPLLVTLDYTFPYEEGVRQGRWMDNGIKLCERNGITLDFEKRKKLGNWGMTKIYLKGAILDINPTLITKIQNFFLRLKCR